MGKKPSSSQPRTAHISEEEARPLRPRPGSESSPLLAACRALSANDIYTMAPKDVVLRGYGYYERQRLQQYRWSPDRATLTAEVLGTRLYEVIFSLDDGFLAPSCDCPAWSPEWLCKHVLCACFTTKNLLSPDTFRLATWQQTRLPLLRDELLGDDAETTEPVNPHLVGPAAKKPACKRPSYEIVIDMRQAYPELLIRRNGTPLTGGWVPALPPELVPLLNTSWFSSGFGEDPLLRYLRRERQPYPIVLESGRKSIPLQWTPSVTCRTKTEMDLVDGKVWIRALCLADGAALERIVRFRTFVIDPSGGRLLYLEDERGWASFRSLHQRFNEIDPFLDPYDDFGEETRAVTLPDGSGYGGWHGTGQETEFTVPLDTFRSVQIDLIQKRADGTLDDLLLKVGGKQGPVQGLESSPEGEACPYRLILTPPPGPMDSPDAVWTLQAECRHGNLRFAPSASTFAFISALNQGFDVSSPLRAQKRKAVLYAMFFALLSVREVKERNQRIRTALARECWARTVTDEAARWLKHRLSVYARPDVRLQVTGEAWALMPIDKAREALLYRIPFEVFGPDAFRQMRDYDRMAIPGGLLFQRLPDLLEKLTAAGIEMLYDDKPLTSSRWDCSVQVEQSDRDGTGIDWFEIRPEIRCDGLALNEAEWLTALRQGGLVKTARGLKVLDGDTLERLRAIVGLTGEVPSDRNRARIVRVPRLHVLDWLALREQGITVSLPAEDEALLGRLMGFTRITTPPLPTDLHAVLRPYQRDGYAWLAFLYEHRFGACLADDMGLGKTLQAICLLAAIQGGRVKPSVHVEPGEQAERTQPAERARGPHLVVVPTSLLFNWEQELARFAPGLKVQVYSGSERTLDAMDGDVVLTTYGLVRRDIDTLERTAFHVIVFDEAQAVKNILSDTTGAVRRLKGRFKLALTGTPLENHLGEYFSVIDLCLPGLLGEYDRFKREIKRVEERTLTRLLHRTRPFILRRTKAQILHDLPPKTESEVFLDLTERQKALYQHTVAQVRSTIDDAYRTKTSGQAQFIALTAILKLRQVCLSPRLLTHRADEPSPKLNFLMERLQVLLDEGHSALVFSQFTGFLDLVQEACVRHELPYHRLDGSTAAAARKGRVKAFQTGERPGVFLLSLKAGGQGLNLTKATYVFHLDPWWNPAVENQASDRAHRIGQQRAVSVVRILMRHSIEEKMMALKQRKLELYDAVMGGAVRRAGQGVLTKADFDYLLAPSGW